jgi:hypothetical protein
VISLFGRNDKKTKKPVLQQALDEIEKLIFNLFLSRQANQNV